MIRADIQAVLKAIRITHVVAGGFSGIGPQVYGVDPACSTSAYPSCVLCQAYVTDTAWLSRHQNQGHRIPIQKSDQRSVGVPFILPILKPLRFIF